MTNREKQLKEMEVVRKSPLVKVGELYNERFGDYILYYRWDEENGFTFHWEKIPVVKWYRTHFTRSSYLLKKLQGGELTSYLMEYKVDENFQPKLAVAILGRELNVTLFPYSFRNRFCTTLTTQEEQLIKEIDEQSGTTTG